MPAILQEAGAGVLAALLAGGFLLTLLVRPLRVQQP